jgi:hypothetical protein
MHMLMTINKIGQASKMLSKKIKLSKKTLFNFIAYHAPGLRSDQPMN